MSFEKKETIESKKDTKKLKKDAIESKKNETKLKKVEKSPVESFICKEFSQIPLPQNTQTKAIYQICEEFIKSDYPNNLKEKRLTFGQYLEKKIEKEVLKEIINNKDYELEALFNTNKIKFGDEIEQEILNEIRNNEDYIKTKKLFTHDIFLGDKIEAAMNNNKLVEKETSEFNTKEIKSKIKNEILSDIKKKPENCIFERKSNSFEEPLRPVIKKAIGNLLKKIKEDEDLFDFQKIVVQKVRKEVFKLIKEEPKELISIFIKYISDNYEIKKNKEKEYIFYHYESDSDSEDSKKSKPKKKKLLENFEIIEKKKSNIIEEIIEQKELNIIEEIVEQKKPNIIEEIIEQKESNIIEDNRTQNYLLKIKSFSDEENLEYLTLLQDEDKKVRRMNGLAKLLALPMSTTPAVAVCLFNGKLHVGVTSPQEKTDVELIDNELTKRIKWIKKLLGEIQSKYEKEDKTNAKEDIIQSIKKEIKGKTNKKLTFNERVYSEKESEYYNDLAEVLADAAIKIALDKELSKQILDAEFEIYIGESKDISFQNMAEHDAQLIIDKLFESLSLKSNKEKLYMGVSILCCDTCHNALGKWNKLDKIQICYSGSIGYTYSNVLNMSESWEKRIKEDVLNTLDIQEFIPTNIKKYSDINQYLEQLKERDCLKKSWSELNEVKKSKSSIGKNPNGMFGKNNIEEKINIVGEENKNLESIEIKNSSLIKEN